MVGVESGQSERGDLSLAVEGIGLEEAAEDNIGVGVVAIDGRGGCDGDGDAGVWRGDGGEGTAPRPQQKEGTQHRELSAHGFSLESFRAAGSDTTGFGFHERDGEGCVGGCDRLRSSSLPNALKEVGNFICIAHSGAEFDGARLSLADKAQGFGGVQVVDSRCVFEVDRVLHVEAESWRHGPSAFGRDKRDVVVEVMGHDVVDGSCELRITAAEDGIWFSEAVMDEIGIMNVQVQESASAGFPIQEEGATRMGGDTAEVGGKDLAERFPFDRLFQPIPSRPEPHAHGTHKERCRLIRSAGQCVGFFCRTREGLLHQHVFAGLQCGHGQRGMVRSRKADVHQFDLGVGDQVIGIGVFPKRAEIHSALCLTANVAGRYRSAFASFENGIGHRHHPRVLSFCVDIQMGDAYRTDTGNSDLDHNLGLLIIVKGQSE